MVLCLIEHRDNFTLLSIGPASEPQRLALLFRLLSASRAVLSARSGITPREEEWYRWWGEAGRLGETVVLLRNRRSIGKPDALNIGLLRFADAVTVT
jgi:hypothetical protein